MTFYAKTLFLYARALHTAYIGAYLEGLESPVETIDSDCEQPNLFVSIYGFQHSI